MMRSFVYGVLNTNSYLVWQGKDAVLVDPAEDVDAVMDVLAAEGLELKALLATHMHFDHVTGCAAWQRRTGLPVLAGREDIASREILADGAKAWNMEVEGFEALPLAPGPASFGALACTAIPVPGHSPGSLCFHFPALKALCSGDTLFHHQIGFTDIMPLQSDAALRAALQDRILTLPRETAVYPGHRGSTTIGEEIRWGTLYRSSS